MFQSDSDECFEGFDDSEIRQCEQCARDRTFNRESDDEIELSDFETSDGDGDDNSDNDSIATGTSSDSSETRFRQRPSNQWTSKLVNPTDIRFVDSARIGVVDGERCVDMSAEELFSLFFTNYLLRDIVDETNRYAAQCRDKPQKKGEKRMEWQDIVVPELKT